MGQLGNSIGSNQKRCRSSLGFTLVEITLAIALAALSLISLMALLPVGLTMTHSAFERASATAILASVLADLQATAGTHDSAASSNSTHFSIPIPGTSSASSAAPTTLYFTSDKQLVTSAGHSPHYRITLTFLTNPSARGATRFKMQASWPATADPAYSKAVDSVVMFAALDRN